MEYEILNSSQFKQIQEIFDKLKHVFQSDHKSSDEVNNLNEDQNITQKYFPELLEIIDKYLDEKNDRNSPEFIKLLSMKASLMFEQAKLQMQNNSESEAFTLLYSILELLEECCDHDFMVFLFLRIINHLSYLLTKNGRLEEARQLLESVLYKEYKQNIAVYRIEDLFSAENSMIDPEMNRLKFNNLMLNNLQMLGWIYGKLGFHDLYAFMEYLYLKKLLEIDDNNIMQWVTKCCRLVSIYLTTFNWIYARYYLAALGAFISKKESDTMDLLDLPQAKAALSKAWINYGLHLFSSSKRKLLERMYDDENKTSEEDILPFEVLEQHKFETLSIVIPNIPTNFITDIEEARILFVYTQNWLKQMRLFYNLRDYPLQYVNTVLDLSELYRFLAFYETDLESQYKVQKRRYDSLEALGNLLKEVKLSCYTAVCIELWRELAEVQIELMGINLKRLYTFECTQETEENIKRRIGAVTEVHDKLETIGDSLRASEVKKSTDIDLDQISSGEPY